MQIDKIIQIGPSIYDQASTNVGAGLPRPQPIDRPS